MQAGKLDRKIKLKTPTITKDSYGGATTTYTVAATVWANVDFSLGESFQQLYLDEGARGSLKDSAVFTIRYRTDITPQMVINYKNNDWRIEGVREFGGRDQYLRLLAARIQNV